MFIFSKGIFLFYSTQRKQSTTCLFFTCLCKIMLERLFRIEKIIVVVLSSSNKKRIKEYFTTENKEKENLYYD